MQVFRNLEHYTANEKNRLVLTTGMFDGVHLGHQQIIRQVLKTAQQHQAKSAVLSFINHPRLTLKPTDETDNDALKLLTSLDEKIKHLQNLNIDYLFLFDFNEEFLSQTAQEFLNELLIKKIGLKHIIVGYDHRFGKNRQGDINFLKQESLQTNRFTVQEIDPKQIAELTVSSTKIRKAIKNGDIVLANTLLAYPYQLSGTVVEGNQIGRTLGYPTANIKLDEPLKLLPQNGIYAANILIDNDLHKGMLYIGKRPTLNGETTSIEINIFDFEQDIYQKNVQLQIIQQTRKDMKFENLEALTQQMHVDKKEVLAIFEKR